MRPHTKGNYGRSPIKTSPVESVRPKSMIDEARGKLDSQIADLQDEFGDSITELRFESLLQQELESVEYAQLCGRNTALDNRISSNRQHPGEVQDRIEKDNPSTSLAFGPANRTSSTIAVQKAEDNISYEENLHGLKPDMPLGQNPHKPVDKENLMQESRRTKTREGLVEKPLLIFEEFGFDSPCHTASHSPSDSIKAGHERDQYTSFNELRQDITDKSKKRHLPDADLDQTDRSERRPRVGQRRQTATSEDGSLPDITNVDLAQLQGQPFDPTGSSGVCGDPHFDGTDTLQTILEHLTKLQNNETRDREQVDFFNMATMAELSRCALLISAKLDHIITELDHIRQEKRKLIVGYENEIANQDQELGTSDRIITKKLEHLRQSGQSILRDD